MSDRKPITTSNIEIICEEFGFGYEVREGHHFASVDGSEVEITFREDGTRPPGRHSFMTAARKANKGFKKRYHLSKSASSGSGRRKSGNAGAAVALDRQLLGRYSLEELEAAWELLQDLIKGKKQMAELEKKSAEKEKELEKLRDLARMTKEMKYPLPDGIEDQIEVLDGEVKGLRERASELRKRMESGEPSQEGLAGPVPAGSAIVATDESKESLEPQ
jgi:hypothetical protein